MDIEQQLRSALTPCKSPPQLRAGILARVAGLAGTKQGGGRTSSRTILFGTVIAVAAAAAILAVLLRDEPAAQVATASPATVAPVEAVAEMPAEPAPEPAAIAPEIRKDKEEPKEVVAAVQPFTVQLLPMQNRATEVAAKAAVAAFYAAFLIELRAVPGLVLDLSDTSEPDDDVAPDFQLTVLGLEPPAAGKFVANVAGDGKRMALAKQKMRKEGKDPGAGNAFVTSMTGDISPLCASTVDRRSPKCTGPEGLAAAAVLGLRKRTFPADPALKQQLQQQLVNASLDPGQRLTALSELADLQTAPAPGGATPPPGGMLQDEAVIRGAVDLAAATSDPALRAQIWRAMRGSRSPEVLQAAIAALGQDSSAEVRLQVIALLQEGFAQDANARGALEVASRQESRPMLRALAQRALNGDTGWKEYIVKSLKDTSRPDDERIEAFMYDTFPPGRTASAISFSSRSMQSLRLLDDETLQAVVDLLPHAQRIKETPTILTLIASQLASLDRPAVTSLLLGIAENGTDQNSRYGAVNQLARRQSDARVPAVLRKLAAEAGDPRLRELATKALEGNAVGR